MENDEMVDVEVFLKQTYSFSVFRIMREDGGGGRSKVS